MKVIALQTLCFLFITLLGLVTVANALPTTELNNASSSTYAFDLVRIVDRLNEKVAMLDQMDAVMYAADANMDAATVASTRSVEEAVITKDVFAAASATEDQRSDDAFVQRHESLPAFKRSFFKKFWAALKYDLQQCALCTHCKISNIHSQDCSDCCDFCAHH